MRRLLLALLAALLLLPVPGTSAEQELKIKLFKAGKADAFLFRYGDKALLLDAGEADDAEDILTYAREKGVAALELVILTHFDKGHVGGMPEILAHLPVRRVLMPDDAKDSNAANALFQALHDVSIVPEHVMQPLEVRWDGLSLSIWPALAAHSQTMSSDHDDISLVVSVVHGNNRLLFTGDIGSARMEELLSQDISLGHCFLKVPAHGRNADAFPRFLDAVQPEKAVITCSVKNPPSGAVMDELARRGVQVWLTMDGNIALTSDGQRIKIKQ